MTESPPASHTPQDVETFAEILWRRRSDSGGGLRFGERSWSWAEVVGAASDRAALLDEWRENGEQIHVGVFLENVPDYVFWLGAAALTGDVVVGVNPTRRGEQLAGDIRHTDCSMLVVEERTAPLVAALDLGITPDRILNIEDESYSALLDGRGKNFKPRWVELEHSLLLLFSSGSTGAPKAVNCSQGRLGGLARALADRMRISRDSVTYLCMPLFHGNAIMTNLAPAVHSGATVVLARRFSASGLIQDIRHFGVTYWNYVGRALAYVLATPESSDDSSNTLELAYGTEASAADAERFSERFACEVMEGYGASEGGLRINRTPDSPATALGLPVGPRQMEIVDEATGRVCAPAEFNDSGMLLNAEDAVGQMVVRGGAAGFEGYYKNPKATAERIRGGDFWTGDLAYRDVKGFVYFAGRTADWMRVDGENLAAAPIERVLHRHPAVSQAVVFGVPDIQTGDQVMATVELVPGSTFTPDDFVSFLAGQDDMGTKWRPHYIRICSELPLTGNGKVARAELRLCAWQTEDPVWVWQRGEGYVAMSPERRAKITAAFIEHGRADMLPAGGN